MSHDVGGMSSKDADLLAIDLKERPYEQWEREIHAVMVTLIGKGLLTVDEMRRGVEALPVATYNGWGYYEKWAASIAGICIERGNFSAAAFDLALGACPSSDASSSAPLFTVGHTVRVRREDQLQRWRKPHLRTPGYIFGAVGTIERYCGAFGDPEFIAFRGQPSQQHLYRLRFERGDLWGGSEEGTVDVEVFESWLLPATADNAGVKAGGESSLGRKRERAGTGSDSHDHSHDNGHSHNDHTDSKSDSEDNQASASAHTYDHGHTHDDRTTTEQNACDKEAAANGGSAETIGRRVAEALVSVLTAEGQRGGGGGSGTSGATPACAILTKAEVARAIENVDAMGTNAEGPRIVARAWVDDVFRAALLDDANAAVAKHMGIGGGMSAYSTKLTAVVNTADVHNVIVCTLCSCYPLVILGLSPPWYKSRSYRARVVREPRAVLGEFGTLVPQSQTLRVHDSTADLRYIVIPRRPAGTDGWDEVRLAALVTRDSMIGVRVLSDVC